MACTSCKRRKKGRVGAITDLLKGDIGIPELIGGAAVSVADGTIEGALSKVKVLEENAILKNVVKLGTGLYLCGQENRYARGAGLALTFSGLNGVTKEGIKKANKLYAPRTPQLPDPAKTGVIGAYDYPHVMQIGSTNAHEISGYPIKAGRAIARMN